MRGVIYYYSATGNTQLACECIARNIKSTTFELVNIAKNANTNDLSYDIVGFAAPTDFWGPPQLVKTFIDNLQEQNNKPAFVFSTYGFIGGKTLIILKDWVQAKGFKVIAGCSLQTPENYPPLIVKGIASKNAPKPKDVQRFKSFINNLDKLLETKPDEKSEESKLKVRWIDSLIPTRPRTSAKYDMGEKSVDDALCTGCGVCKNECPYDAIELNPKPVFNMEKCYGCWSCFNQCPSKAIYTNKIRGKGHYPKPLKILEEKLK